MRKIAYEVHVWKGINNLVLQKRDSVTKCPTPGATSEHRERKTTPNGGQRIEVGGQPTVPGADDFSIVSLLLRQLR